MKTIIRLCLVLVSLSVPLTAVSAQRSPDELLHLAKAGAPTLALSMMNRYQPDSATAPAAWTSWERVRLEILREDGRWRDIVNRVKQLPEELPADFLTWARTQQALAHLQLGEGAQARALLRSLIWDAEQRGHRELFATWRRLVIESYLADGYLQDARTALLRYSQDYGEQTSEERLLRARVLLRVGESQAVGRVLGPETSAEAQALRMMARLQSDEPAAGKVRVQAQQLARKKATSEIDRARLWYVAASAAGQEGDYIKQAWYLERALIRRHVLGERDRVFRFDGDDLWQAYLNLGQVLGNRAQLLIGEDSSWLEAAETAQSAKKKQPMQARAYYAVVALEGLTAEARDLAHRKLTASLLAESEGEVIVDGLYLSSKRFHNPANVPLSIRHVLASHALGRGQIKLASQLMAGLSVPPEGVDAFVWQLRRARVHIVGGQEDEGIDALYSLLAQLKTLDKTQADRFMQVLFDLQTVKRHQAAINLFVAVQPRLSDAQQRREVLFWQADSHKALAEYEQAAWLYLRSATLLDPYAFDPWAQTCRFHAAEALADAGLVKDARTIYQELLRLTSEQDRRIVLRHKLQQLQLRE